MLHTFTTYNQLIHSVMFIGPCIVVIVEEKRPTWCHLLFYFTSYVLSMFRTLIYPSSGACDYSVELPHWSYCSWFDVCWSFGVVGLEWYLCCRLKPVRKVWKPLIQRLLQRDLLCFFTAAFCILLIHTLSSGQVNYGEEQKKVKAMLSMCLAF